MKPSVTHERVYLELVRRLVLDPTFAALQGLVQAQSTQGALTLVNIPAFNPTTELERGVQAQLIAGSDYQRRRMIHNFFRTVGIDIRQRLTSPEVDAYLRRKVAENVNLIRTIPPRSHQGLSERIVSTFQDRPFDQRELGRVISREYRAQGYNLRRIVRDQTSKIYGQLAEIRGRQVGADSYRWRTAEDSRVRPSHAVNNNRVFAWADPPVTGHPGAEIQCRCIAQFIIDA